MTPEQCRELAEFHEHMAEFCRECSESDSGIMAVAWAQARIRYSESARYWREKAGDT